MSELQISDFQWYKNNLKELFRQYGHCFVAIHDKSVVGVYQTYAEGVYDMRVKYQPETYIVQECGQDASAYTNYIASFNFVC